MRGSDQALGIESADRRAKLSEIGEARVDPIGEVAFVGQIEIPIGWGFSADLALAQKDYGYRQERSPRHTSSTNVLRHH
jgi:hypothetical protein